MKICFSNTKGGVGKSTLAVHTAAFLHDQHMRVALLDLDRQRSSSQWIAEVEPNITVRTADTPDACLAAVQDLAASYDFVVADLPGGLDDLSRTMLLLADLALFPITPSILDVRSVQGATSILRFAQQINQGKPAGTLIFNRIRHRETISRELRAAAPTLGFAVAENVIRDLQAFRDAAQQGTVVSRLRAKGAPAAADIEALLTELLGEALAERRHFQEVSHG